MLRSLVAVTLLATAAAAQSRFEVSTARGRPDVGVADDDETFAMYVGQELERVRFGDIRTLRAKDSAKGYRLVLETTKGRKVEGHALDEYLDLTTTRGAVRIHLSRSFRLERLAAARITPDMHKSCLIHWSFDDVHQDVVDTSVRGFSGKVHGAVPFERGVRGGAARFHGAGDRVELKHRHELDLRQQMTISMWVQLRGWGDAGEGGLCNKGLAGQESFSLVTAETGFSFIRRQQNGQRWVQANHFGPIRMGAWHHVVAIVDDEKMRILVDGVAGSAVNYQGIFDVNSDPITVGSRPAWSGDYEWGVDCAVDEFRLFDRALDADEIRALRQLGIPSEPRALPRVLEVMQAGGPSPRKLFEAMIRGKSVFDGMDLDAAMKTLGPPHAHSNVDVSWYENPFGKQVEAALTADYANGLLSNFRVVMR